MSSESNHLMPDLYLSDSVVGVDRTTQIVAASTQLRGAAVGELLTPTCPVIRFEKLTTAISTTLRSSADCLLNMLVPRLAQPSITPWSVNEDQLRLGSQRQVRFTLCMDKRLGVQKKL